LGAAFAVVTTQRDEIHSLPFPAPQTASVSICNRPLRKHAATASGVFFGLIALHGNVHAGLKPWTESPLSKGRGRLWVLGPTTQMSGDAQSECGVADALKEAAGAGEVTGAGEAGGSAASAVYGASMSAAAASANFLTQHLRAAPACRE
jgi:hypothetical protein